MQATPSACLPRLPAWRRLRAPGPAYAHLPQPTASLLPAAGPWEVQQYLQKLQAALSGSAPRLQAVFEKPGVCGVCLCVCVGGGGGGGSCGQPKALEALLPTRRR